MFYVPYKLRNITEFTIPKGPDFTKARRVSLNLGGNIVSLKINKHKPIDPSDDFRHVQRKINIYDPEIYKETEAVGDWQKYTVLYGDWRFNGPMFTGSIAEVRFAVSVLHRKFSETKSMFNPRHFEQEVLSLLTEEYSEEKDNWVSDWVAPVTWLPHDSLSVFAVSYDTFAAGYGKPVKRLTFPISEDCLVTVYFSQYPAIKARNIKEYENLVDHSTMEKLCYAVISSVQLELSLESQAQWDKAQQEYPNQKLSSTMAPLKWTTDEEDQKRAEYLKEEEEYQAFTESQKEENTASFRKAEQAALDNPAN